MAAGSRGIANSSSLLSMVWYNALLATGDLDSLSSVHSSTLDTVSAARCCLKLPVCHDLITDCCSLQILSILASVVLRAGHNPKLCRNSTTYKKIYILYTSCLLLSVHERPKVITISFVSIGLQMKNCIFNILLPFDLY